MILATRSSACYATQKTNPPTCGSLAEARSMHPRTRHPILSNNTRIDSSGPDGSTPHRNGIRRGRGAGGGREWRQAQVRTSEAPGVAEEKLESRGRNERPVDLWDRSRGALRWTGGAGRSGARDAQAGDGGVAADRTAGALERIGLCSCRSAPGCFRNSLSKWVR